MIDEIPELPTKSRPTKIKKIVATPKLHYL